MKKTNWICIWPWPSPYFICSMTEEEEIDLSTWYHLQSSLYIFFPYGLTISPYKSAKNTLLDNTISNIMRVSLVYTLFIIMFVANFKIVVWLIPSRFSDVVINVNAFNMLFIKLKKIWTIYICLFIYLSNREVCYGPSCSGQWRRPVIRAQKDWTANLLWMAEGDILPSGWSNV